MRVAIYEKNRHASAVARLFVSAVGGIKYRAAQSNSEVCLHTKRGGYMKKTGTQVLLRGCL